MGTPDCMAILAQSASNWPTGRSPSTNEELTSSTEELVVMSQRVSLTSGTGSAPILTSKAEVILFESRTTGSGCVFCLIGVEKSVGREFELSMASRHCFGLGGPSLSTTESCSSDSVAERGWS